MTGLLCEQHVLAVSIYHFHKGGYLYNEKKQPDNKRVNNTNS